MPHNQCQSTQLWGLQHLWLANEISLPVHHRVPNWPEPGQRGAVGVCLSETSRTYRLTNMQLNWPSVTSLWWKYSCLVPSVIHSQESDGLAQSAKKVHVWFTASSIQGADSQASRIWHWPWKQSHPAVPVWNPYPPVHQLDRVKML